MKKINKRFTSIALSVAVLMTAAVFSVPAVADNVRTLLTGTAAAVNADRTVTVSDEVIKEDFVGIGSNLWLGPKDSNNMTDAYYEVNYKRIQTMRPAFMRMMFLPHWLMDLTEDSATVQENWESGVYDWDNENLQFFLEYVGAFKEAGTIVQLNMGGRVDNDIIDWFGIKDVAVEEGGKTAPRDLESFAKATASLLKYCWDEGYENVKYLSFYNEVNGSNYEAFGDKRVYWVKMLQYVNNELKKTQLKDGRYLSEVIEVIGSELSFNSDDMIDNVGEYWAGYITDNASNYFNRLSVHFYHQNIAENTYKQFDESLKKLLPLMPDCLVTEYMNKTTTGEKSVWTFGTTLASYVASMANNKASGAASWFFCGAKLDDAIGGTNMNLIQNCNWVTPSPDGEASRMNQVSNAYYEDAMMMRFIPKNGKTLKTTISGNYDLATNNEGDIVAAAFKSEDGKEATVMLVVDGAENARTLNLSINGFSGKTFNKFVLNYADKRETVRSDEIGNALLPTKSASLTAANGTISDTLPTAHSLVIYTTYSEPVQVAFEQLEYTVKAGENVSLKLDEVYGTENKNVTWEVLCGGGTVDANGLYTATADATVGDTIAVSAVSAADSTAYGVSVIKIIS